MVAVQKSPEARIRARFAREAHKLRMTYDAALWAMERTLKRSNPQVAVRIRGLRRDIEAGFGLPTRVLRTMLRPILAWTSKREDRRLANGVTYEPQTFVERHNWLEESAESTKFRVVPVAQCGFRPS